ILISWNGPYRLSGRLLQNRLMVGIGKISFSLYMWHQLLLAYTRYFLVEEPRTGHLAAIFGLTVALSVATYFWIEKPFRDKSLVGPRTLLVAVGVLFMLTTVASLYVYQRAGILKDMPELGLRKADAQRNLHAQYNLRVFAYDRAFTADDRVKILVIGDSFARDWANVLLESKYAPQLEISYLADESNRPTFVRRISEAAVVFYSIPDRSVVRRLGVDSTKLWAIGTKNFGRSNGIFYNH